MKFRGIFYPGPNLPNTPWGKPQIRKEMKTHFLCKTEDILSVNSLLTNCVCWVGVVVMPFTQWGNESTNWSTGARILTVILVHWQDSSLSLMNFSTLRDSSVPSWQVTNCSSSLNSVICSVNSQWVTAPGPNSSDLRLRCTYLNTRSPLESSSLPPIPERWWIKTHSG